MVFRLTLYVMFFMPSLLGAEIEDIIKDNVVEPGVGAALSEEIEGGLDPALGNVLESAEGLDPALIGLDPALIDELDLGPNAKTVIGIVTDGMMPLLQTIKEPLKRELDELLGVGRYRFKDHTVDSRFTAGWVRDEVAGALQAALDDDEVDLILAVGLGVIGEASRPDLFLNKPVVGVNVLKSTVWGPDYTEDGKSPKKNFTFNILPRGANQDLNSFHDLVGFQKVYVIVDQSEVGSREALQKAVRSVETEVDFAVAIILAGEEIQETIETIKAVRPEALYLTVLARYSVTEQEQLISEITKLGIPTYSMIGHFMVELGALAGQSAMSPEILARRVALNIQAIKRGTPPEDLGVFISIDSNLVINARTAKAIGFFPDFSVALTADFIHQDDLFEGKALTIEEVIQKARNNNIEVLIQQATTARTEAAKNVVRSDLLPQASVNSSYSQIDSDRARLGAGPEWRHTAGLSIRQLLFSDTVISNFRSSIKNLLSQQAFEESVRLDAANQGAQSYLNLLLTRALLKVEVSNLKLTQSNLQLAKLRETAGTSGREEVFRWESEVAAARSRVFSAVSLSRSALVALNQILNVSQTSEWLPEDIVLETGDMNFLDNQALEIISNERLLTEFRNFSVRKAFVQSPTLQSIDQQIAGQQITLGERRRSFYLPEVSMQFSYDRELDADYRGGRPPTLDRDDWRAFVVAELPLFEGWRRPNQINRERSELDRLVRTQIQATQIIEQNTRNAIFAMESSLPSIRLTRIALDRAEKNLDLVRDRYIEGTVDVTDLIDAQQQTLQVQRSAAETMYTYLGDLYNYQRAISWFEVEQSDADRQLYLEQLRQFIEFQRQGKNNHEETNSQQ